MSGQSSLIPNAIVAITICSHLRMLVTKGLDDFFFDIFFFLGTLCTYLLI